MRTRPSVASLGFLASCATLVAYGLIIQFTPQSGSRPAFTSHREDVLATYPFLRGQLSNVPSGHSLHFPSHVFVALHLLAPPLIVPSVLETYPGSPFRPVNAYWLPTSRRSWFPHARAWLHDAWGTDARFLLQALLLSGFWWWLFSQLQPWIPRALRSIAWRSLPLRILRRARLFVPLGLLGAALLAALDIDDWLDDLARRDVILEQAERGRLRADRDIQAGRLAWPQPCRNQFLAAEWCRLYGIECSYVPFAIPNESSCLVTTRPLQEVEVSTYNFFMRAHLDRLVGADGFEYMTTLAKFESDHRNTTPLAPANPGMQRTRYARR